MTFYQRNDVNVRQQSRKTFKTIFCGRCLEGQGRKQQNPESDLDLDPYHTSEAWFLGSRSYHICLMVEGSRSASGSMPLTICFLWLNSFRVLCNKIVCSMTVFINSRNVRYLFPCRQTEAKPLVTAQLNKITSLYLFFIEPPPQSTVPLKGIPQGYYQTVGSFQGSKIKKSLYRHHNMQTKYANVGGQQTANMRNQRICQIC